jgi:predicted AlkP superfamily pyrophosphatase or phosphodiesterase
MDQVIELSATEDPDFVFVNLGNVDAIQHVSGPNSPAADAAVLAADTDPGRVRLVFSYEVDATDAERAAKAVVAAAG